MVCQLKWVLTVWRLYIETKCLLTEGAPPPSSPTHPPTLMHGTVCVCVVCSALWYITVVSVVPRVGWKGLKVVKLCFDMINTVCVCVT